MGIGVGILGLFIQHPQKIPPLQNTNFRIKTGKKRQDTMSNKKLMERSPL